LDFSQIPGKKAISDRKIPLKRATRIVKKGRILIFDKRRKAKTQP